MAVFVVRRLAVSFLIVLASTFVMYVLVANSGDPLGDLRTNPSPNRADLIAARTQLLDLDTPVPQRYVKWLGHAAGCAVPVVPCDLGKNVRSQDVSALLGQAATSTLKLVLAAAVLALVLGVGVGIVSALRQYSGFDYTITFSAFLFFSLPIFWVAVLLKQYLSIGVNDWYRDPRISVPTGLVMAAVSGLAWGAILGGSARRKWVVRGIGFAATFAVLMYLSYVDWFARPALGPVAIAVFAVGAAFAMTALTAGLNRRGVLYSCLATAGVGIVAQFAVTPFISSPRWATWGTLAALAVVTVLVGCVVGWVLGGLDKAQAMRASVLTGLATGSFVVVDVVLRALPSYSGKLRGRVLATIGSGTPNFSGSFWERLIDTGTHLLLPTLALILISFAQYSRFSRASMLEVMNQDYVRTARSKGLTERTVVMRHAFRNALIPLTTVAAIDFGALIGGAVITENVFGWAGMGQLFIQSLLKADPNPVMGFYIVTAVSIVVFNMLADIAYAYLDPRIRLS